MCTNVFKYLLIFSVIFLNMIKVGYCSFCKKDKKLMNPICNNCKKSATSLNICKKCMLIYWYSCCICEIVMCHKCYLRSTSWEICSCSREICETCDNRDNCPKCKSSTICDKCDICYYCKNNLY